MVINELKEAVVEMVGFIIPPFLKLITAIIVSHYVTYGVSSKYLQSNLIDHLKALDVVGFKQVVDNLYLGSVVPIIVVLVLITIAYSINRIISFISSLVPISYITTSTFRHHREVSEIWQYFPEINSMNDLYLKVNQLCTLAQSSKYTLNYDQVKWQEEGKEKLFQNLSFVNFLLIWSIFSYVIVKVELDPSIQIIRLFYITFSIVLIVFIMSCMIARKELDIESSRLMVVNNLLRIDQNFNKIDSKELLENIDKQIRLNKYYSSKWWSLAIGYRFDWLLMYKCFRPPFYWSYQVWKDKREIKKHQE